MIIRNKKTDKNFTMTLKVTPVLCQASTGQVEHLFPGWWQREELILWSGRKMNTPTERYWCEVWARGGEQDGGSTCCYRHSCTGFTIFGHANWFLGHCQQRILIGYLENPGNQDHVGPHTNVRWGSIKALEGNNRESSSWGRRTSITPRGDDCFADPHVVFCHKQHLTQVLFQTIR